MTVTIRAAEIADLDALVRLLVSDARQRHATAPDFWKVAADAEGKVRATVRAALEAEAPPFRQNWLIAEADGRAVGVAQTILLPVPPIYAGEFGAPGLIMETCHVTDDAPADAAPALLQAAETDLVAAGAGIVLGSAAAGGRWEARYAARGYQPLTLYLARIGLRAPGRREGIRTATDADIADIVRSSAANRQIQSGIDGFWKPHGDADARFGAWMKKSLTLGDRDMFVSEAGGAFAGYAIAQPATPLHVPAAHDIGAIGIVDDFFHTDLADPERLRGDGAGASDLLGAAEAALGARGNDAALVVCPAGWASKRAALTAAGYRNAITWFVKR